MDFDYAILARMSKIDRLVRSKRKTIALIIERDGTLTVRAPQRMSHRAIEKLVSDKEGWIAEKQAEMKAAARLSPPHSYQPGETFLFLGESYPLEHCPGSAKVVLESDVFKFDCTEPDPAAAFESWYRQAARKLLTERVAWFASRNAYPAQKLRISGARTRWGSCSSRGSLSFTWRLVMAPLEVVDYVVVHELVHLEHPNHSREFWQRVGEIMPDYRARRGWLNANGAGLNLS
jgi:predicted metal-dependent hydrolase